MIKYSVSKYIFTVSTMFKKHSNFKSNINIFNIYKK